MNVEDRLRLRQEVIETEPDEFGDAHPSGDRDVQHRAIAEAAGAGIWSVDDRLCLLSSEVADEATGRALRRNREDPADLVERRGHAVLDVAEQRLDRCEPRVASHDPIASFALEMIEERHHQGRVQLFECNVRWWALQPTSRELEQQNEAMAVRDPCVGTRIAFERKPNAQEL